ncbi:MAG: orotidine 5'-phosphate decarboxylase / HUMPS family protein, partial [Cyanobacteriota bacterium]
MDPPDRIIVALDGMYPDEAVAFAAALPSLRWVKVGLELFVAGGPSVVQQLRQQGKRVFLDLKFHDIPATMAGACRSCCTTEGPPATNSSRPTFTQRSEGRAAAKATASSGYI